MSARSHGPACRVRNRNQAANHGAVGRPVGGRWIMIRVEKILYPTDFSSHSNQAYFHAIALAESHGASLTILYVWTPGSTPAEGGNGAADRRHWQNQLEQIRPVNPEIAVSHMLL